MTLKEASLKRKRVLILCTGNSCRSQMAEGVLRHCGGTRYEVFSAGTKPSPVNETAVQVMAEIGLDISSQQSKHVSEFVGQSFDYVVTVCNHAKESCLPFSGKIRKDALVLSGSSPSSGSYRRSRGPISKSPGPHPRKVQASRPNWL